MTKVSLLMCCLALAWAALLMQPSDGPLTGANTASYLGASGRDDRGRCIR